MKKNENGITMAEVSQLPFILIEINSNWHTSAIVLLGKFTMKKTAARRVLQDTAANIIIAFHHRHTTHSRR